MRMAMRHEGGRGTGRERGTDTVTAARSAALPLIRSLATPSVHGWQSLLPIHRFGVNPETAFSASLKKLFPDGLDAAGPFHLRIRFPYSPEIRKGLGGAHLAQAAVVVVPAPP